jgi:putative transposase
MVELATRYGRYGYRRVAALLRAEGFAVNHKRVERLWRREGLKVPARQPKRRRLWLNDGSCVRLRPEYANHVWSYDFVKCRTADGRAVRLLTVIDEHTRECLAIAVARRITANDVLDRLSELFVRRGVPAHVRADNGPEFAAFAKEPGEHVKLLPLKRSGLFPAFEAAPQRAGCPSLSTARGQLPGSGVRVRLGNWYGPRR